LQNTHICSKTIELREHPEKSLHEPSQGRNKKKMHLMALEKHQGYGKNQQDWIIRSQVLFDFFFKKKEGCSSETRW